MNIRYFAPGTLAVAAVALTMLGSALAAPSREPTPVKTNLVLNPGAEAAEGSDDGSVVPIPNWQVVGNFTAVKYGIPGFPPIKESTRIRGGDHFFAGGPEDHQSRAIQVIDISDRAVLIDKQKMKVVVRAEQAGWPGLDTGQVIVAFLDAKGKQIGEVRGPVVGNTSAVFQRMERHRFIPKNTRKLRVLLLGVKHTGVYLDAYFDNIDVRIGRRGAAF